MIKLMPCVKKKHNTHFKSFLQQHKVHCTTMLAVKTLSFRTLDGISTVGNHSVSKLSLQFLSIQIPFVKITIKHWLQLVVITIYKTHHTMSAWAHCRQPKTKTSSMTHHLKWSHTNIFFNYNLYMKSFPKNRKLLSRCYYKWGRISWVWHIFNPTGITHKVKLLMKLKKKKKCSGNLQWTTVAFYLMGGSHLMQWKLESTSILMSFQPCTL